jgi:hypothetical protein
MFVFDDLLKVNYSHNGEEIGDFTILFVNKNPLCEWQSLTRRCNFHHQCTNLLYYKADILMLIASYHDFWRYPVTRFCLISRLIWGQSLQPRSGFSTIASSRVLS